MTMTRLDKLRSGDWVRWQERWRKLHSVQIVSDHLVQLRFQTSDTSYHESTRAIGAGLKVPTSRKKAPDDGD